MMIIKSPKNVPYSLLYQEQTRAENRTETPIPMPGSWSLFEFQRLDAKAHNSFTISYRYIL